MQYSIKSIIIIHLIWERCLFIYFNIRYLNPGHLFHKFIVLFRHYVVKYIMFLDYFKIRNDVIIIKQILICMDDTVFSVSITTFYYKISLSSWLIY